MVLQFFESTHPTNFMVDQTFFIIINISEVMFQRARQDTINLLKTKPLANTSQIQPIRIASTDVAFQLTQRLASVGQQSQEIPKYIREQIDKKFKWNFVPIQVLQFKKWQDLKPLSVTPILNKYCQIYFGRLLELMIQTNPKTQKLYNYKGEQIVTIIQRLLAQQANTTQFEVIQTYLGILKQQDELLFHVQYQSFRRQVGVFCISAIKKVAFADLSKEQISEILMNNLQDKQVNKDQYLKYIITNKSLGTDFKANNFTQWSVLLIRMRATFGRMLNIMAQSRKTHLDRFFSINVMPKPVKSVMMDKVLSQGMKSKYAMLN